MRRGHRIKKAGRPRKHNGDAHSLSRDVILQNALQLIDQRGLDAFNMRELARALDVAAAALYWHVPSRIELISGVVELVMNDFAIVRPTDSWQTALRRILRQFRAVLRKHPGLAPLVATKLVSSIAVDAQRMNQIVTALEQAGFRGRSLVDAYNVVVAAMCGFATLELSSVPADEAESWEASCRRQIGAIDRSRWPALVRHIKALTNNAFMLRWSSGVDKPLDSSFDAWVDIIIRGLEAQAGAKVRPNRRLLGAA